MKYVCTVCGYIYDEAKEPVPFDKLPDDWRCPWCGAAKSDFAPMEEKTDEEKTSDVNKPEAAKYVASDTDTHEESYEKLSAGQLAALCSNLARGCEKQYKLTEAELFKRLADSFKACNPAPADASVEGIADALAHDTGYYGTVREICGENSDRGALRALTWAEKVTKMLSSLVKRYLNEGEKLAQDDEIWVCTICGFVYIGKNPPELCPVCKVQSRKFEKIAGRVNV